MKLTDKLRSELICQIVKRFDRADAYEQFQWAKLLYTIARSSPQETRRILSFISLHTREEHFAPDAGKTVKYTRRFLGNTLLKVVKSGQSGDVVRFTQGVYPNADAVSQEHLLAAIEAVTRRHLPDLVETNSQRLSRETGRKKYPEHADRIVRMATNNIAGDKEHAARWLKAGLTAANWAGGPAVIDFVEHGFKKANSEQREKMARLLLQYADTPSALRVVDLASALGRRHPEFKTKMVLVLAQAHLHAQHSKDEFLRLSARNAMERIQFPKTRKK